MIPTPALIHIMFADNNPGERELFQQICQRLKMKVRVTLVESGDKLLTLLEKSRVKPEMVFIDVKMPEMNGLECLVEIKKIRRLQHIPIVMYGSGYDEDTINEAILNGADYYFIKPININKTVSILNWLLVNRHQNTDKEKHFLLSEKHFMQ